MAERTRHRDALARELGGSQRRIAVGLAQDLFQIAKGELPDRVMQRTERLAGEQLVALMHRLQRVTHAAFVEELRLAEIRIPAGTADPAAHHEAPSRHPIDVASWYAGEQSQNLVAHGRGAALIGVETEDPVAAAGFDRAIAQIAEALERHLHDARAQRRGHLGRAVGAVGIDDDDFVRPEHAFGCGLDLLGLIEGQDIGGDRLHDRGSV